MSNQAVVVSPEHLNYELQMFLASAGFLPVSYAASGDNSRWFFHNLLLEGAVMHGRVLAEFLFGRDAEVAASDYLRAGESVAAMPPELVEFRRRANREVAHLTRHRIAGTPPEKQWSEKWFRLLFHALCDFTDRADPRKLDPEFTRLLDLAVNFLATGAGDHAAIPDGAVRLQGGENV